MANRPTLLNSCARASSAAEARFRIGGGPRTPRSVRVVALDAAAADVVRPLTGRRWHDTRFLTYVGPAGADRTDTVLESGDGTPVRLDDELAGADLLVLVAVGVDGAPAVPAFGDACARHGVPTAGVVIGACRAAVSALRPFAQVLLVTADTGDLSALLRAVGA